MRRKSLDTILPKGAAAGEQHGSEGALPLPMMSNG
jgi:hypothetical protein